MQLDTVINDNFNSLQINAATVVSLTVLLQEPRSHWTELPYFSIFENVQFFLDTFNITVSQDQAHIGHCCTWQLLLLTHSATIVSLMVSCSKRASLECNRGSIFPAGLEFQISKTNFQTSLHPINSTTYKKNSFVALFATMMVIRVWRHRQQRHLWRLLLLQVLLLLWLH